MTQYLGVSGVARKVKSPYVGVNGVSRKISSGYVGVSGIARKYYSSKPVSRAVIKLVSTSGDSSLSITDNSYSQGSSDDGMEAQFILNLYNSSGNLISYETLDDISGLESFELDVSTYMQIFYGSGTIQDVIFGLNATDYEVWSSYAAYAKGSFTVTQDNFTSKYIEVKRKGSCQRDVTFGSLYINGEEIPFTVSN